MKQFTYAEYREMNLEDTPDPKNARSVLLSLVRAFLSDFPDETRKERAMKEFLRHFQEGHYEKGE